mmetsp:Transcript_41657/g.61146  ORF Transcript_41657/g.61146 Transcript_41657/m.61146 type:complete len:207 (-) Transcript_41657:328-948(-)
MQRRSAMSHVILIWYKFVLHQLLYTPDVFVFDRLPHVSRACFKTTHDFLALLNKKRLVVRSGFAFMNFFNSFCGAVVPEVNVHLRSELRESHHGLGNALLLQLNLGFKIKDSVLVRFVTEAGQHQFCCFCLQLCSVIHEIPCFQDHWVDFAAIERWFARHQVVDSDQKFAVSLSQGHRLKILSEGSHIQLFVKPQIAQRMAYEVTV